VNVALGKESSRIFGGFSFNIYTMAEASDFKFSTLLGFAKAHHKITPIALGKSGCGLGLGELPNLLGSL